MHYTTAPAQNRRRPPRCSRPVATWGCVHPRKLAVKDEPLGVPQPVVTLARLRNSRRERRPSRFLFINLKCLEQAAHDPNRITSLHADRKFLERTLTQQDLSVLAAHSRTHADPYANTQHTFLVTLGVTLHSSNRTWCILQDKAFAGRLSPTFFHRQGVPRATRYLACEKQTNAHAHVHTHTHTHTHTPALWQEGLCTRKSSPSYASDKAE